MVEPQASRSTSGGGVATQVADVVRGMAGGREALQPDDLVADDDDVLLRHGRKLSPERVELVAVEPPCAGLQARGIDEVRRPDRGDVHRQLRVLLHEHAGGARVVEMDVREQQMAHITQLVAALREPRFQRRHTDGRAAIEEGQSLGRVQKVRADGPRIARVKEVDRLCVHGSILRSILRA